MLQHIVLADYGAGAEHVEGMVVYMAVRELDTNDTVENNIDTIAFIADVEDKLLVFVLIVLATIKQLP